MKKQKKYFTKNKMTLEEAQHIVNLITQPTVDAKDIWIEKYLVYCLSTNIEKYIEADKILEFFYIFHQFLKHSPELAKELVTVLEGLINHGDFNEGEAK